MSFWTSLATDFGSNFMKTLGSGAASYGSGRIFQGEGESRGQARKNYHTDMKAQQVWTEKNARLGRDLDVEAQQEMFDFRLNRAKEAGLTNVEAFGSPASGAGGGTGAATTTLGNSAASSGAQMRSDAIKQKIASEENQKDRMAMLAQTAMQTETQKEVAETQAGATTGAAQISADAALQNKLVDKAIADGRLALDRDTLNENIKLISSQVDLNRQEIQKKIHETATADPKFVTAMKQLSMGPANLLVELTMRHHGIALNDTSFKDLPVAKREAILAQILALNSRVYTETKGGQALGNQYKDSGLNESIVQTIFNALGIDTSGETDLVPQNSVPNLGNYQSGPFSASPDMNAR